MQHILKRKQQWHDVSWEEMHGQNALWAETLRNIEQYISVLELNALIATAGERMALALRGHRRGAIAWSGGKDSVALEFVARANALTLPSLLGICHLEFPEMEQWMLANLPPDTTIIRTPQDIVWLLEHPEFLFPDQHEHSSQILSRWYKLVQHAAQDQFCKEQRIDVLFLGRRTLEGNYCGKDGQYERDNVLRVSPLYDWPHEAVLAIMHYYCRPLAPVYHHWPYGWLYGPSPWPQLRDWAAVYAVDPYVVRAAAVAFPSAHAFLAEKEPLHVSN